MICGPSWGATATTICTRRIWKDHQTGKLLARELYDYETDPDGNGNVADEPENRMLVEMLSRQLDEGWRGALPGKEPE